MDKKFKLPFSMDKKFKLPFSLAFVYSSPRMSSTLFLIKGIM